MKIEVKAVEGRIARISPNGPFIPHDRYIPVVKTNYIARLLDHHGDIEQKPEAKPAPAPVAASKPKEPTAPADKKEDS